MFRGKSHEQQLAMIMEYVKPDLEMLNAAPSKFKYFTAEGKVTARLKPDDEHPVVPGSKSFADMFEGHSPDFIDFITKCLKWDPKERMTPKEALQHPWITNPDPDEDERVEQALLEQEKETASKCEGDTSKEESIKYPTEAVTQKDVCRDVQANAKSSV
eukprot:Trichotokara_eunicae@DN116_c0_g1_i1.p1